MDKAVFLIYFRTNSEGVQKVQNNMIGFFKIFFHYEGALNFSNDSKKGFQNHNVYGSKNITDILVSTILWKIISTRR